MDKPINERFIKLSSRIAYPENIEIGEDIVITFHRPNRDYVDQRIVNCVKVEYEDTQEGSVNVIYKLKSLTE